MSLSVSDILELADHNMGLIGPDNSKLIQFLERIFGWIDYLRAHSILHDAYGRFYLHYKLDRGYCYPLYGKLSTNNMRRNFLCGQASGLIDCWFNNVII